MELKKDADFIAALTLFQNKRDAAIGLSHITTRQKGFLWYYNVLRQEQVLKATTGYAALKEIEKRIKKIIREAQNSTIERQRELLIEALKLEEQARQWQI